MSEDMRPNSLAQADQAEQAQTNCQGCAEVGMPPDLWAMKRRMDPLMWQQVLKHRAISMVDQEMAARRAAAAEVEKKVGAGVGPHVADLLRQLPNPDEPLRVYRQAHESQHFTSNVRLCEKAQLESHVEAKAGPMSPVSAEIQQQHLQLDELGETLERLEDRLRPVLDGAATGWAEKAQVSQAAAPLLEDLQSVSGRLAVFQERLQQVLARLVL